MSTPTNNWDFVMGINQDFLTTQIANLYNDGKIPSHFGPEDINGCTVEFNIEEPTLAFADSGDCGFTGAPQLIVLTVPVTDGTLDCGGHPVPIAGSLTLTMNLAEVAISAIGQPNYLQMASGASEPANCGSLDGFTSNGCTLEAWIQTTYTDLQTVMLFGQASPRLSVLQVAGNDTLRLNWGGNYYDSNDPTKAPILDGQWHHIAITVNGGVIAFYKDGQLKNSFPMSAEQASAANLQLGAAWDYASGNAAAFDGLMTHVRVWNYARSTEQVQQAMNVHLDNEDGLIGYWAFDDNAITNQVNGNSGSLGAGDQIINLDDESLTYALNLYFLDPGNVFCVTANVSDNSKTNDKFESLIQSYLDKNITPQPVNLGIITPPPPPPPDSPDGKKYSPPLSAKLPTYAITALIEGESGEKTDDELVLMAMMENRPQPAGDPYSAFNDDAQIALPSGSKMVIGLWDYYLFDSLLAPAMADKFDVDESYFSVSQDPAKLRLEKDLDYKRATITELTMQIKDGGLSVKVKATAGPALAEFSGLIMVTIQGSGDDQKLILTLNDPSISIMLNWDDPKVAAAMATILLLLTLAIGEILVIILVLFLEVGQAIGEFFALKKVQDAISDQSGSSVDSGAFEITDLVFDEGVFVYLDFTEDTTAQAPALESPSAEAIVSASASAPVITGFNPSQGDADTSVTISGAGFSAANAVRFNGVPAPYFRIKSDEQIIAQPGDAATTGLISVTTPSGTGVSASPFTVLTPPVITGFSMAGDLAVAGDAVIITGSNFTQSPAVSFGSSKVPAAGVSVNAEGTQITATIAAGAISGPIFVTTPGGQTASAQPIAIGSTQNPVVQSFNPGVGAPQSSVTIAGANFAGTTQVSFNGVPAYPITLISDSQLVAYVPQIASTGPITVTNNQGTSIPDGDFTVTPAPIINGFAPAQASLGQPVVITGENFAGATSVTFGVNTMAAAFTVNPDGTQITASVPSGAVNGPITVTTPGGSANTRDDLFTVVSSAPPKDLSFTPDVGAYGTQVTISGLNFTGTTGVTFNGVSATPYTVMSDTEIIAYVPTDATSGPIGVANNTEPPTSPTLSSQTFTFNPPPSIENFDHANGKANDPISISGQYFTGATSVTFGANKMTAPFTVTNDGKLINTSVPLGAVNGPITITTPGGTAVSPTSFQVLSSAAPADLTFSPSSGPLGSSVTISGRNFTGATGVSFFNEVKANSYQVLSDTQITARVPNGAASGPTSVANSVAITVSGGSFTVTSGGGDKLN